MCHLIQIMGVTWRDKITNVEILTCAALPSMADILVEKGLRWLGHIHRMKPDRLPRQLLKDMRERSRN